MTKDEPLKLALEALERYQVKRQDFERFADVITAIKEALAQPEPEPVAWMFQHDETGHMSYVSNDGIHDPTMFLGMNPRYALVCPLYTTPPQRKPLPYEQLDSLWQTTDTGDFELDIREFARAIEAAHGIKENNI
jgi:hypothetical protein